MNKIDIAKLESLKVSEDELLSLINKLNSNYSKTISKIKKKLGNNLNRIKDFPNCGTVAELQLIMLYLCKGKLLNKDIMAKIGSIILNKNQSDWQIRHLAAQSGFYILGKGDLIPNTNLKCPSGFHMLLTLDGLSPKYMSIKRIDLLTSDDFNDIKNQFGNRCAHCNSLQGTNNYRDNSKTKLQKGHLDPNKPLEKGNIIPMCAYCNRTYKDTFKFSSNGSINKMNFESERVSRLSIEKIEEIHGKNKIYEWLGII